MHGYEAREGLGITLTMNQIVDDIPNIINISLGGICLSSNHLCNPASFPFKPDELNLCDNILNNFIFNQIIAAVSTIASPFLNSSSRISTPRPGASGALTYPSTGTGMFLTKYGYWCVYFQ